MEVSFCLSTRSSISGQVECQFQKERSKFMIVAGDPFSTATTEVLSLASIDEVCEDLARIPSNRHDAFALEQDGKPVVCGGHGTQLFSDCYQYNPISKSWDKWEINMGIPKTWGSSINIGFDEWWLMGGMSHNSSFLPTVTTEIFKNGEFRPGPNLIEPSARSCATKINSTHAFFGKI